MTTSLLQKITGSFLFLQCEEFYCLISVKYLYEGKNNMRYVSQPYCPLLLWLTSSKLSYNLQPTLTEHWGEMRGWFNSEVESSQTFPRPFLSQIRLIFWSASCILLCCWLRRIIWLVWWRHSDKNTDERINFFRDLKF